MNTLEQLLSKNNIKYRALSTKETHELNKLWLESFASKVKKKQANMYTEVTGGMLTAMNLKSI